MFEYKLLFILLFSNALAIFLQAQATKLGCVTGLNIAELCRTQFPLWANILLYIIFEVAILATDLAEVIGTAVAMNMLFKIPLVVGVVLTMLDVLIVLFAWRPDGSLRAMRYFEMGVAILVCMVVCCFVVLLAKISGIQATAVLKGYLPNKTAFSSAGIYTSLSILGAVVMPHSLILGSGLTQSRMRQWDIQQGHISENVAITDSAKTVKYKPTLGAINSTLTYSIVEISISLMTFALFVNSAILIVAGATLYNVEEAANADLFGIRKLLSTFVDPAAGTIFAIALLASGQSAGIVVTMAGQLVSEGFFNWTMRPWLRRLLTRSIAIMPCIVVAGAVGREGLAQVLNASQVALSLLLPFIAFPIIYFASKTSIMQVPATQPRPISNNSTTELGELDDLMQEQSNGAADETSSSEASVVYKDLSNSLFVQICGWLIWSTIAGLNIYLIVILVKTGGEVV